MKPKEPQDPISTPAPRSGPLADLVDDKLNRPLADQIAEEIEERREQPPRSGASDYAGGTGEHDDDPEA
jgi:hypothetical protein